MEDFVRELEDIKRHDSVRGPHYTLPFPPALLNGALFLIVAGREKTRTRKEWRNLKK